MDLALQGKTALVTGSSSGIGSGIAAILAAEGVTVAVHGRNRERATEVAEGIIATGGSAIVVLGDLTTEEDCTAVANTLLAQWGGVDILVNNAGGRKTSGNLNPGWLETPWQDWLGTFEQNIGAAVRLIQHLVPGMKERHWGRIINIGSASATQTLADMADYQAVKAAMTNMTTSLSKTLAYTGITVNTVTPGTITTPAVVKNYKDIAAKLGMDTTNWREIERRFTTQIRPIATDHFGKVEDIGRMVALLASPHSDYMTGANYRIDGGQCKSIN